MIDAIAASASHVSCVSALGAGAASVASRSRGPCTDSRAFLQRRPCGAAHSNANAPYAIDHAQPSSIRPNHGSSSTGNPSSASNDAKFDSANNRYGTAALNRRQYHDCSSGVVVDSRKYGRPIVTASNSRMRTIGSSSPRGFQSADARIGSVASDNTSKPICSSVCLRTPSRVVKSAYA